MSANLQCYTVLTWVMMPQQEEQLNVVLNVRVHFAILHSFRS